MAIDLDHDGVDEVVAIELPDAGGRLPLRIYRPLTPGVRTQTVLVDATAIDVDNAIVADSDGVAGDELLAVANQWDERRTVRARVDPPCMARGAPAVDIAPLSVPGPFAVLRHGGHPLIVLSSPELGQTVAASWPANGPSASWRSAPRRRSTPLTVIGSGTAERLLARPTADAPRPSSRWMPPPQPAVPAPDPGRGGHHRGRL